MCLLERLEGKDLPTLRDRVTSVLGLVCSRASSQCGSRDGGSSLSLQCVSVTQSAQPGLEPGPAPRSHVRSGCRCPSARYSDGTRPPARPLGRPRGPQLHLHHLRQLPPLRLPAGPSAPVDLDPPRPLVQDHSPDQSLGQPSLPSPPPPRRPVRWRGRGRVAASPHRFSSRWDMVTSVKRSYIIYYLIINCFNTIVRTRDLALYRKFHSRSSRRSFGLWLQLKGKNRRPITFSVLMMSFQLSCCSSNSYCTMTRLEVPLSSRHYYLCLPHQQLPFEVCKNCKHHIIYLDWSLSKRLTVI